MMRKFYIVGLIAVIALIVGFAYADQITFSTYYPAPFGVYREMRIMRVAIGETYHKAGDYPWDADGGSPEFGEIHQDADLVVEGNVGIGTTDPDAKLTVENSDQAGEVTLAKFINTKAAEATGQGNHAVVRLTDGDRTLNLVVWPPDHPTAFFRNAVGITSITPGDSLILESYEDIKFALNGNTEAVTIANDGNVGIGTTNPGADLEVNNTLCLAPTDSPNHAEEGALHYDNSEDIVKYHDGTDWKPMGGGWQHSGEVVYDASPVAETWTDVDCSSVVGSNYALVFLKVKTTWGQQISFRPKGESDNTVPLDSSGCAAVNPSTFGGFVIVETGPNGNVQFRRASSALTTITLYGYVKG